jgi:hypothetical protein
MDKRTDRQRRREKNIKRLTEKDEKDKQTDRDRRTDGQREGQTNR